MSHEQQDVFGNQVPLEALDLTDGLRASRAKKVGGKAFGRVPMAERLWRVKTGKVDELVRAVDGAEDTVFAFAERMRETHRA